MFFVTKIRSATLATKILKNQGLVLKTIGVNLIVNIDNSRKNLCLSKRMQHAALVGKTKIFSVRGRAEGATGYRL